MDAAVRPCHDGRFVFDGLRRLTVQRRSRFSKAVDARGQCGARLGGPSPDMARDLHGVGVVVAAARDGTQIGPPLEGQADGRSTRGTKVNEDLLLAPIRNVRVLPELAVIEPNRVELEDGLGVKG